MRELDVFDLLPREAWRPIDELGYSFLRERGYKTAGCMKSHKRRARLKDALKKRGEELRFCCAKDDGARAVLIWFLLYRGEEIVGRSRGIKLLARGKENGERES